jgi:hypothetical protein
MVARSTLERPSPRAACGRRDVGHADAGHRPPCFPDVRKIGILNSANPSHPPLVAIAIGAAAAIGISAESFAAPNPEDVEKALADMKAANCDIVYVLADPPRPYFATAWNQIRIACGIPSEFLPQTSWCPHELRSRHRKHITRAAHYVDRIRPFSKIKKLK